MFERTWNGFIYNSYRAECAIEEGIGKIKSNIKSGIKSDKFVKLKVNIKKRKKNTKTTNNADETNSEKDKCVDSVSGETINTEIVQETEHEPESNNAEVVVVSTAKVIDEEVITNGPDFSAFKQETVEEKLEKEKVYEVTEEKLEEALKKNKTKQQSKNEKMLNNGKA